jgi:Cu-Zn family superoxide dismutase
MKRYRLLGTLLATAALGACSDAPQPRVWGAWADLINTRGIKIGDVQFAEREDNAGVVLRLQAWSLPPGSHGFHIHDSGTCDTPSFNNASGHFNPFGKKHGLLNPEGPHAGDLPNLVVPASGRIDVTFDLPSVTLKEGRNSLLQKNGTSVVIHSDPDDGVSDPAGNSGARIACGVIRSLNPPQIETR